MQADHGEDTYLKLSELTGIFKIEGYATIHGYEMDFVQKNTTVNTVKLTKKCSFYPY